MDRYRNLGILGVRWLALMSLVAAVTSLSVGALGPWAMGHMGGGSGGGIPMGADGAMPYGWGHMMGGGWGMWWGPTVIFALVGVALASASRALGSMLAAGLDDGD